MRRFLLPLIAWMIAFPAGGADREAGKAQAMRACAVCHGPVGLSMAPNTPHLAGQSEFYLREQLRRYRSGQRQHEVMAVIARSLTDEEIDNLSEWFSAIRVEAHEP